jgi:hypothetical protein
MPITREKVIAQLRKYLAEQPNTINPRKTYEVEDDGPCTYLSTTGQRCLVGQAVWDLTSKSIPATTASGARLAILSYARGLFDPDAMDLLQWVQSRADARGVTWGEAIRRLFEDFEVEAE